MKQQKFPHDFDWRAAGLRQLYSEEHLGCVSIAKIFGCHPGTVRKALIRLGVPTRPRGKCHRHGQNSPLYKHGLNASGYRRFSRNRKNFLEHRVVVEQLIGRPLGPQENVHHCDGDRANNDPANLWVFPSKSAHKKYHETGEIHPNTIKLKEFHSAIL
jgi:hypothetical protein